ncbi:MAG: ATP-binding cassette domain-containing protein [Thermaerobacter sp.]|nr:ATP-binding cassette domain-containing protein [Thermaerobacter sp.]
MEDFFRAAGVEAGYGALQVLWGVELSLQQGESVVLLGANGAGKTTLLRTLLGLVPLWRGEIRFLGRRIETWPTETRVRAGLAFMTEQGVFPNLSVEENLAVGGFHLGRTTARRRIGELYEMFADLREKRREPAANLSGGQRKLLAVAKAVVARPRLLLMDEPSAGLAPRLVGQVVEILRQLHRDGLTLFIAEQNVKFLELAQRTLVLEGGRVAFRGTVEELRENDAARKAYFGLEG